MRLGKDLEDIKDLASSLQASDIFVEPINENNRPKKRIKYIDKIISSRPVYVDKIWPNLKNKYKFHAEYLQSKYEKTHKKGCELDV